MKAFILKVRGAICVFAVLYAAFAVQQFASRDVWWGDRAAVVHVIFWTLAPPLWFLLEWWATPAGDLPALKENQDKAGKLWAAVLVVILYFFPKGPLQEAFGSTPEAKKTAEAESATRQSPVDN